MKTEQSGRKNWVHCAGTKGEGSSCSDTGGRGREWEEGWVKSEENPAPAVAEHLVTSPVFVVGVCRISYPYIFLSKTPISNSSQEFSPTSNSYYGFYYLLFAALYPFEIWIVKI